MDETWSDAKQFILTWHRKDTFDEREREIKFYFLSLFKFLPSVASKCVLDYLIPVYDNDEVCTDTLQFVKTIT